MVDRLSGPEYDQVPPLSARTKHENDRRTLLLDLVHGSETVPSPGTYESGFFLSPSQVFELFRETHVGELFPGPNDMIVDVFVEGLLEPGEFWTPPADKLPQGAMLRRTITEPGPKELSTQWRRSLGVAFQFNHTNDSGLRTVTADFEVGVTLLGARGIFVFTKGSILVNNSLFIVQNPAIHQGKTVVVDEFLANVDNLTKPPIYRKEFEGVDLSDFERGFGDSITIR